MWNFEAILKKALSSTRSTTSCLLLLRGSHGVPSGHRAIPADCKGVASSVEFLTNYKRTTQTRQMHPRDNPLALRHRRHH